MNRKLLKGLLVLAVATGGVATFTSCKDENYIGDLKLQDQALQAQINAIRSIQDEDFKQALKDLFDQWYETVKPNIPGGGGGTGGGEGTDGTDGKNALYMVFDPTFIAIPAGATDLSQYTSTVTVYEGQDKQSNWEIGTDGGNGVGAVAEGNKIVVKNMEGNYGTVTVTAKEKVEKDSRTLTATLVVIKMVNGADGGPGEGEPGEPGEGMDAEAWLEFANYWSRWFAEQNGTFDDFAMGYPSVIEKLSQLYGVYKKICAEDYESADGVGYYVDALYNMMFKYIYPGEKWFNQIEANTTWIENLNTRATSVSVSQTYNGMFGTFNLPFNTNSMMLSTYMYLADGIASTPNVPEGMEPGYYFPYNFAVAASEDNAINAYDDLDFVTTIQDLSEGVSVELVDREFTAPLEYAGVELGNMGGAFVTINPASADFSNSSKYTVELVKSNGEVVLSSKDGGLTLEKYNGVLNFGASRADAAGTGVYALKANANSTSYQKLLLDLNKSALKDAVKQVIDNKSITSMAVLGKTVFDEVANKLPAYAVKVSWTEYVPEVTNVGSEENPYYNVEVTEVNNFALSDFNIAATALHPLSYSTLENFGKKDFTIPTFKPIEHYLQTIQDKFQFDINIKPTDITINDVNLSITLRVKIVEGENGNEYIVIALDKDGNEMGSFPVDLKDNTINASGADLTLLVNAILDAVAAQMNSELNEQINSQVISQIRDQLDKAISDINTQIQEQLEANLGKVDDFFNDLKNSSKLHYVNDLINYYNRLVPHLQMLVSQPGHYLQVFMLYSTADGAGIMSTDKMNATPVTLGKDGGYITLFPTSYTADLVVPSYKKYVAITAVEDAYGNKYSLEELKEVNEEARMQDKETGVNMILQGSQERLPVNLPAKLKGKKVTFSYVSVDYRGRTSFQNYYLNVK